MTMADDRELDLQTDDAPEADSELALSELAIDELDTDDFVEPDSGDLPQEMTESYGTGVHDQPGLAVGGRRNNLNEASPTLTGGDIDANYEQANADGDESVGGTVSTPDMDVVDELGAAVGLEMNDRSFLRTNDILEERDASRWELEPRSSEDYAERRDEA